MNKKYRFGNIELELPEFDFKKFSPIIMLGIIIFLGYLSVYSVQADEQGIVLRLGKYHSTSQPGLHFKIPLFDQVYKIQTKKQFVEEFGFRTLEAGKKSKFSQTYEDESWTLTNDLSVAEVKWQVQYIISDPKDYKFNVRNVESTIRDISESVMREIVGDMDFDKVIKEGRASISSDAQIRMQQKLDALNAGINIKMVQLQTALPPETVMDAYNQVARALQNMEKMINQAERDSSLKYTQATGEALKIVSSAKAYRFTTVAEAEGEVEKYLKVYQSYLLDKNIFMTTKMINMMKEILSNVDKVSFVDPTINAIPLFNLNDMSSNGFNEYMKNKK